MPSATPRERESVCVCVCVRERERICVWEGREGGRERERERCGTRRRRIPDDVCNYFIIGTYVFFKWFFFFLDKVYACTYTCKLVSTN